jgi:glutathione S-transferase
VRRNAISVGDRVELRSDRRFHSTEQLSALQSLIPYALCYEAGIPRACTERFALRAFDYAYETTAVGEALDTRHAVDVLVDGEVVRVPLLRRLMPSPVHLMSIAESARRAHSLGPWSAACPLLYASAMITVRTTKDCPNTPRVLFGLEELGLDYECVLVEDGTFSATYGSPGPEVVDGDVRVIEPFAIFRHLVRREQGRLWPTSLSTQADADRWLDFQGRRLSAALKDKNPDEIMRLLGFVEKQVAKGPWFMGPDFTMVDVVWSLLALPQSRAKLPIAKFPALSAYLDRVSTRPAYARGFERTLR